MEQVSTGYIDFVRDCFDGDPFLYQANPSRRFYLETLFERLHEVGEERTHFGISIKDSFLCDLRQYSVVSPKIIDMVRREDISHICRVFADSPLDVSRVVGLFYWKIIHDGFHAEFEELGDCFGLLEAQGRNTQLRHVLYGHPLSEAFEIDDTDVAIAERVLDKFF